MFCDQEFINFSRHFVCVRLEAYENKEHQDLIRKVLNGRLANTAFTVFSPDGKKQLSNSGRAPRQGLSNRRGGVPFDQQKDVVISSLKSILKNYQPTGDFSNPTIQDFHSFGQALRTSSADQRLLVFTNGSKTQINKAKETLSPLFAHEATIGRYNWDFSGAKDTNWHKNIIGSSSSPSITIIQAGKYGLDGTAIAKLPIFASLQEVGNALTRANAQFKKTEKRKIYGDHIRDGRRDGIRFQNEMPHGEDRDADGKIDASRNTPRSRS